MNMFPTRYWFSFTHFLSIHLNVSFPWCWNDCRDAISRISHTHSWDMINHFTSIKFILTIPRLLKKYFNFHIWTPAWVKFEDLHHKRFIKKSKKLKRYCFSIKKIYSFLLVDLDYGDWLYVRPLLPYISNRLRLTS